MTERPKRDASSTVLRKRGNRAQCYERRDANETANARALVLASRLPGNADTRFQPILRIAQIF